MIHFDFVGDQNKYKEIKPMLQTTKIYDSF